MDVVGLEIADASGLDFAGALYWGDDAEFNAAA
jgi:hypothetical protein